MSYWARNVISKYETKNFSHKKPKKRNHKLKYSVFSLYSFQILNDKIRMYFVCYKTVSRRLTEYDLSCVKDWGTVAVMLNIPLIAAVHF